MKYDSDGAQQWARQVPGPGIGGAAALAIDGSGSLHVTGGFVAFLRFAAGESNETIVSTDPGGSTNVFVAKYDTSGGLIWVRTATGAIAAVGRAVAADAAGNTYLTGDFGDPNAGPSRLTFGLGEPNETTLRTEFEGEIFGHHLHARLRERAKPDKHRVGIQLSGYQNPHLRRSETGECSRKPETTRLIAPLGAGSSARKPSARQRKKASNCPRSKAQRRSLTWPGLICAGQRTSSGTRMPPSYKSRLKPRRGPEL